jgi:phytoene dehydrogenase-like protein
MLDTMTAMAAGAGAPAGVESADALILGTGFAGLCAAIRLGQAGGRSFIMLEKSHDVGGTWRDNVYPGCACDVPSHLYSLSFAPKTDWSRMYATQPEIFAYLQDVADRFALGDFRRPAISFRELGFFRRSDRQARGGDRHGRQRHSVHSANCRLAAAPYRVSAHAGLDHAETGLRIFGRP